jgi:hypothetical protein
VYGPGQPANRFREFLDRSDPEVTILPPTHNAHYTYINTNCNRGPYLQFLQQFILNAFKSQILLALHPRTQINIVIQILKDGGASLLPTCINATTVALLDAGIPLTTPLTAVHCAVMRDSSDSTDSSAQTYAVTVEPSASDALSPHCHALCYFVMNRAGQMVAEWNALSDAEHVTHFTLPEHVLSAARRAAVSRGEELQQFIRRTVRDKVLYESR